MTLSKQFLSALGLIAIAFAMAAASAVAVVASDVLLLIFLGVLFSVFLVHVSLLVGSASRLAYRWNFAAVLATLFCTVVGAAWFAGPRIEDQLHTARQQLDDAGSQLRERLSKRPHLRRIIEEVPIAGEIVRKGASERQSSQAKPGDAEIPDNQEPARESSEPNEHGSKADGSKGGQASSQRPASESIPGTAGSLTEQTYAIAGSVAGTLGKVFATTFGVLANMAVILFVGVFIAADPDLYKRGLVSLFPPHIRERATGILERIGNSLWRWLVGRFLSMLITGAGTGISLWLLDVPLPVTLGVVTGLLTFIPNIGGVIALGLAVLLALPQGTTTATWVVAVYLALQLVESNVITPLIQQQQVSAPPALMISFQLLMAALAGFLGVMVATPLLAAGLVVVKTAYLEDLLGDENEEQAEADETD